jgi:pilus assembly protein TadC
VRILSVCSASFHSINLGFAYHLIIDTILIVTDSVIKYPAKQIRVHVLHALFVLVMGLVIVTFTFFIVACEVISSLEDLGQICGAYQKFIRYLGAFEREQY